MRSSTVRMFFGITNSFHCRTKASGSQRLRDEYDRLVQGLRAARSEPGDDDLATNPVLPEDVLSEAVPGNIRKAEHFVVFMKRFVEYLKVRALTLPCVCVHTESLWLRRA